MLGVREGYRQCIYRYIERELQGVFKSTFVPEAPCQILSMCPISKQKTVVETKFFSPQDTVGEPCAESEETNTP